MLKTTQDQREYRNQKWSSYVFLVF